MIDAREEAAKEQRLLILRALLADTDRYMTDRMVQVELTAHGHRMGEARVRILLSWLRDAACVTIEDLGAVWGVTLTPLGAEVVRTETVLPGIAHPMDVR
jgi:hypothetical protein